MSKSNFLFVSKILKTMHFNAFGQQLIVAYL